MTLEATLQHFLDQRLVAVLRTDSAAAAEAGAAAVIAGGARIVEVTWTVPDAAKVLEKLRKSAPPEVLIGAGTILDEADLDRAQAAGADFIISPDVNPELVRLCRDRGILHAPGAMTPTEIRTAVRNGALIVKIFPIASLGGAAHIRALRGPLPGVPFLVSGGVALDKAAEFFAAGTSVVGLTDTLIDPAALREGRLTEISGKTREWVDCLGRLQYSSLTEAPVRIANSTTAGPPSPSR